MTNASTYCLKAKTEYGEKMFGCELFRMWEICYSAVRLTKKTAMFINVDINLVFCLKYLNANFSTLSSWHFACLFGVHSYLILQGLPLQKGRVKTILQPLFSATSGNNMTFYGFSSWAHLSPCLIQTNNICLCTKYIADTVLSFKSPQTWLVVLGLFFFLTSSWMMCKVKQQVYFFMLTLDTLEDDSAVLLNGEHDDLSIFTHLCLVFSALAPTSVLVTRMWGVEWLIVSIHHTAMFCSKFEGRWGEEGWACFS